MPKIHGCVKEIAEKIYCEQVVGSWFREIVTFEGYSVAKLKKAFREAVDDYILASQQLGKEPDKEFKGSFTVRVKPKIHRLAVMKSAALKISLNQFVEKAIEKELS